MTALKSVNNFTCKLFNATYRTSLFNSSVIIMLICIERFIVVWFPLKSRKFLTRRLTILSVAACIATTIVIVAIPSVLYGGIRNGICYHDFEVNDDGESDTIQSTPLLSIIVVLFVISPILIVLSLTPLPPTNHPERSYNASVENRTIPNVRVVDSCRGCVPNVGCDPLPRIFSHFR